MALHCWITKALLTKGSPHSNKWMDELIKQMNKSEILNKINIILQDNNCLTPQNHCAIKLLYKQRFLISTLSKLDSNNIVHLDAAGNILGSSPLPAVRAILSTSLKLAECCLEKCSRTDSLIGALRTIGSLLENPDSTIVDQTDELLGRLLNLSINNPVMIVRIDALKCIRLLAKFPLIKTLPHKQRVLLELAKCLDDKKRLVRKEAVNARGAWFLLDAPA